jgi:RHS repeat-associated protein
MGTMQADMPMTDGPYYRARYYDPIIGRFISEDPVGFWGGFDFYTYVLNDPADLIDPMGESPCLNIRNFVDAMNKNAAGRTTSGGQCAGAVKKGLVKGGLDVSRLHNGPQNYGSGLVSLGFQPIDNHASLKPGDIMIFQPWKNKPGGNGHIQVWNGSQWVSDYMQENMRSGYPGPGSTYERNDPLHQLYRDSVPCP